MRLTAEVYDLELAQPFRIARGVQRAAHNVLVRVESDGLTGIGEGAPKAYYGETPAGALAAIELLAEALGDDPLALEAITERMDQRLAGNAAAKVAIEMALYDLAGQRLGVPVWRLLGLSAERAPLTSYTVSIDTPARMAASAQALASEYPVLKIKLGTPHDLEIVRAIRDATDATLRVDANAAWTPKQAIATINALAPYGIEFFEQPVARDDIAGLRLVREHVAAPIFADESCVALEDVPRLAGAVDGINIKLMKCGGLRHALRMIHTARAHHLKVMLGCMIESSVAITAAAHLTPLVDYADLDGALLLAHDPYAGVAVRQGRLVLPERPGLGVVARPAGAHAAARVAAPSADEEL
ncbi:MAG TPA: dipeptide epimerase [Ktedonobacterales bacterium]|jgi:L-alanine-DL-glutamate epimerase-like enolase superfamily enzyme